MKQIEVIIMGQSYILGCPEGKEPELRRAVAQVDKEMTTIRDSGKLKARERIAVLAALNIAFENLLAPTAQTTGTPVVTTPGSEGSAAIEQLVRRIDAVLHNDGQLL